MAFKEQFTTLKNNWLIILLLLFLMFFFMQGGSSSFSRSLNSMSADYATAGMSNFAYEDSYLPRDTQDFAPEVEERIITKTAWLTTTVDKNSFSLNAARLKEIVTTTQGFILNENVNKYGVKGAMRGTYTIKVPTPNYEEAIVELKTLGEVDSFRENTQDITGKYTSTQASLAIEKTRLTRYESLMAEATNMNDKITLESKIFDQERRIEYLEKNLNNQDQRVEYTTVTVTLQERQSDFVNVSVVKFSTLLRQIVESFNGLVSLVFILIPWAIAASIFGVFWRIFKRKKNAVKIQK